MYRACVLTCIELAFFLTTWITYIFALSNVAFTHAGLTTRYRTKKLV